ncbi:MAG: hypothetical protein QM639_01815 [Rhodocyclaceae bacterium]
MMIAWAALCAVASAALLAILLRTGWAWRIAADHPNERSLHVRVTPRVGGLGLMLGVGVGAAAAHDVALTSLCACALALAALSLADDRRGLPIAWRFAAHWLAAAVAVAVIFGAQGAWAAGGVGVLACVWMSNLYNFMDGADGMAGGMALIGFGTLACMQPGSPLSWVAVCIAGAAGGFLIFNWHPARVFMGDCGSVPLGFLAAALGLAGIAQGSWPWWFPWWVFAPFIADASVTLLRRALRGERIWLAHREHYYQRVIRLGASHAHAAALWYGAMLVSAGSAAWAVRADDARIVWVLAGAVTTGFVAAAVAIDWRWRRHLMREEAAHA